MPEREFFSRDLERSRLEERSDYLDSIDPSAEASFAFFCRPLFELERDPNTPFPIPTVIES